MFRGRWGSLMEAILSKTSNSIYSPLLKQLLYIIIIIIIYAAVFF